MRVIRARGVPYRDWVPTLRRRVADGNVTDRAAQVSYYLLLSFFPFLFFVTALAAYLPLKASVEVLLTQLSQVMPAQALNVLAEHLRDLVHRPRPNFLTLGVLASWWMASRGVNAFRLSLNHAYQVKESRSFVHTQGLALLVTIVGAAVSLVALMLLVLGRRWGAEELLSSWIRWPLAAFLIMLLASFNYFLLPNVKQRFVHVLPGAGVSSLMWLVSTYGFGQYVEHVPRMQWTYGSIGGVMLLMVWLYLAAWVFIFGGELNSTLEKWAQEPLKDSNA